MFYDIKCIIKMGNSNTIDLQEPCTIKPHMKPLQSTHEAYTWVGCETYSNNSDNGEHYSFSRNCIGVIELLEGTPHWMNTDGKGYTQHCILRDIKPIKGRLLATPYAMFYGEGNTSSNTHVVRKGEYLYSHDGFFSYKKEENVLQKICDIEKNKMNYDNSETLNVNNISLSLLHNKFGL